MTKKKSPLTSVMKKYRLEKDLKADVKLLLNDRKAKFFMPVPTGFSENAVDFLVCYKGTFLSVETKIWPRKITTQQSDFSKEIIDAGGVAALAYDLPVIVAALDMIDNDLRCDYIMTDRPDGLK